LAVVPDIAARPVPLPRAFRRFDGDHVGAEIGERLDAHRAEQEMVEADDADSLQEIEHAGSPTSGGTLGERGGGPQIARSELSVVPANSLPAVDAGPRGGPRAGTHAHRCCELRHPWPWVPAFAGTTALMDVHQRCWKRGVSLAKNARTPSAQSAVRNARSLSASVASTASRAGRSNVMPIACLHNCSATLGSPGSRSAIASAALTASPGGTTRSTRPQASAVSTGTGSPKNIRALARPSPMRRVTRM